MWRMAKMLIKHEVKPSALLASRPVPSALFHVKHEQGNAYTILRISRETLRYKCVHWFTVTEV